MKLSEQDILQLEALWRGELTLDHQKSLEERFEKEPDFKEAAIHWQKIIYQGFRPNEEELNVQETIRRQLKELEAELPPISEVKTINLRRRYIRLLTAAVVAILIISVGSLIFLNNAQTSSDYFEHLDRDNANLSAGPTPGEQAYDAHNYKEAWSLLEQEIEIPNDSLNLLYGGVAAVGAGEYAEATRMLNALLNSSEWTYYHEEVKWYLGIAYLRDNQEEKSKEIFEGIVASQSKYQEDAKAILEKLSH